MEGSGGAIDNLSAKPRIKPQEAAGRAVVEQIINPDAEPSGIYNLPARVGGMEKRLGEISANERLSPEAFIKKIRKLEHKSLWLSEGIRLNRQVYEDKFGKDVIEMAQQGLEEFPGKIKTSNENRANIVMMKSIQKLREAGYSE